MRIIYTVIITLLTVVLHVNLLYAQEMRVISGTLKDASGEPLPGVNITIKGTETGTVTDANGDYRISAPVGSTLVFSFIGMKTREVLVTGNQQVPRPSLPAVSKKTKTDITPGPGIAVLQPNTPTYRVAGNTTPSAIAHIRPSWLYQLGLSRKAYTIVPHYPYLNRGLSLQYISTLTIEKFSRVPALQSDYVQGESYNGKIQWRGADLGVGSSWGPLLRTLTFDGTAYPFDRHGRLQTAGNGLPAQHYDASDLFRTGIRQHHHLIAAIPLRNISSNLTIEGEHERHQGIIPRNTATQQRAALQWKQLHLIPQITLTGSVRYQQSTGTLLNRGSNLAAVLASVWQTPISFDNANGLTPRQALASVESYQLPDGSPRSHLPGQADNPYALLATMPDQEKLQRWAVLNRASFSKNDFEGTWNISWDQQHSHNRFGLAPGSAGAPQGRLTDREETQTSFQSTVNGKHPIVSSIEGLEMRATYILKYDATDLARRDAAGFASDTWLNMAEADNLQGRVYNRHRMSHEWLASVNYLYAGINAKITGQQYYSSTAQRYRNFFPTVSAGIDMVHFLQLYPIDKLKIYTSSSKTIREAPLLFRNWSYGSTQLAAGTFNRFFENTELYFVHGLLPETTHKTETGLSLSLQNNLSLDVSYASSITRDLVTPVYESSGYALRNAAAVRYRGIYGAIQFNKYAGAIHYSIKLNWSHERNKVLSLATSTPYVPLAGFSDTQTVLAPGQPVGAIYGAAYQRDDQGRLVIGEDGYPLVDPSLRYLGNPIPQWTMGLEHTFQYRKFNFSMLWDIKYGGQVWNGTQARLDYEGRSATTAAARTTSQYIFDGVTPQGMLNATPVTFYDPTQPVDENRWRRYGPAGVGEMYVQDASWLRLQDITLGYQFTIIHKTKPTKMSVGINGKNLLLVTPYTGVDPATTLFGYSNGTGLDLFNIPSVRSYSLRVSLKL